MAGQEVTVKAALVYKNMTADGTDGWNMTAAVGKIAVAGRGKRNNGSVEMVLGKVGRIAVHEIFKKPM